MTPMIQPRMSDTARRAMVLRETGLAFIAGVGAGLVTGSASRVAMKISALADPSELVRVTENGNIVGDFTIEGTLGLLVFAGLFPGILAGGLFASVRPWLARSGRKQSLIFGAALLLMSGSAVIEPANADFQRFGPPALNVALFAALFFVLGAALAVFWRMASRWPARILTFAGVFGMLAIGGAMVSIGSAAVLTFMDRTEPRLGDSALGLGLIVATIILAIALRRLAGVSAASYAVLAAPVAIGAVATVRAIALILSG